MKKILIIFLLFTLFNCESFFFEEYKIIETKILKNNDKFYKVKKKVIIYIQSPKNLIYQFKK